MDLKTYFFAMQDDGRVAFAKKCGTSFGHMRNVAYGYKPASTELAVAIERESKRAVTRQEMFPDTFNKKWPELRPAKQKAEA